jgi:plasmid stability protein
MASITIRGLDEHTKKRLRVRAARNGRSMEAEAREILRLALEREAARRGELSTVYSTFTLSCAGTGSLNSIA